MTGLGTHDSPKRICFIFLLEAYEARYMHALLASVLEHARPESILLIHDAIWVQPEIPRHILINAIAQAESVSGLHRLRLKVTRLQHAYAEIVGILQTCGKLPLANNDIAVTHEWWLHHLTQPKQLPPTVQRVVEQQITADCHRSKRPALAAWTP